MKKIISILMVFSVSAIYALGTDSGTEIKNEAILSYKAGGVSQPDVKSNEDKFLVDKKIDMVLVTDDTKQTEAAPGEQDKVTSFSFENEGNSDENFKFEVKNLDIGAKADYNDKEDSNDVEDDMVIKYSTDDGNTWEELPSDGILKVDEDATIKFRVEADMKTASAGAKDKDVMNIELKATAYKDDKSAAEEETTGSDTQDKVDIVFADGESVKNGAKSGLGDSSKSNDDDKAGDGMDIARSGYIIKTPVLEVDKTSCPISDPVNNTTNPKRIPGAVIRYMFDIENKGTADASGVVLKDSLNDNLDLDRTKDSAKKKENQDSCDCATEPSDDISGDTTVSGQDVKIENIGIESGKHTCVSFEIEIK